MDLRNHGATGPDRRSNPDDIPGPPRTRAHLGCRSATQDPGWRRHHGPGPACPEPRPRPDALLRGSRRGSRPRLGAHGRGPHGAEPDRVRGRGQNDLHDQHLLGRNHPNGECARPAPRRESAGRATGQPVWPCLSHAGGDGGRAAIFL